MAINTFIVAKVDYLHSMCQNNAWKANGCRPHLLIQRTILISHPDLTPPKYDSFKCFNRKSVCISLLYCTCYMLQPSLILMYLIIKPTSGTWCRLRSASLCIFV